MKCFADTNWLVATHFCSFDFKRTAIVERFLRKGTRPLIVSDIGLLEAENVFARLSGQKNSLEWLNLTASFGQTVECAQCVWPQLKEQTRQLVARYAHKAEIGTFDCTLVSSALLAAVTCFLSFDETAKALAAAERLRVFPELTTEGRTGRNGEV